MKIIESVPNFSEGRNAAVIEQLVNIVRGAAGVRLLDYSSDANHNRTVITYAGSPEAVGDVSVALAEKAVELIDLTKHSNENPGEHPRIGAVDVMPFVPVEDVSMDECVALSRVVAARIYNECGLPVYLYENSATADNRKNLADIRRGQFEGLSEKMKRPEWRPDFGEPAPHKTAGAVAVGARGFLIAFNINLNTNDITIAQNIAKIIRQSNGGLDCVKAIAVKLDDCAQISVNITDYKKAPLYRVLEFVKFEAARYGAAVLNTELIGLAPADALFDCAEYYLRFKDFKKEQVLDAKKICSKNFNVL